VVVGRLKRLLQCFLELLTQLLLALAVLVVVLGLQQALLA
jgi:hypothetical protein